MAERSIRRWRFSFGLKFMLLALTVGSCVFGRWASLAHRQKSAVATIKANDGAVHYKTELGDLEFNGVFPDRIPPPEPNAISKWIASSVGVDFAYGIRRVRLSFLNEKTVLAIGSISSLEELYLETSVLENFGGFTGCDSLRCIDAYLANVKSFEGVGDLSKLTHIHIYESSIKTLAGLEKAQQLKSLDLDRVAVSKISELANCRNLEELSLVECAIEDLSPLRHCEQLTDVTVTCSKSVTDLKPFESKAHLSTLWLRGADLQDLRSLAGVPIENLTLLDCDLKSLDGIAELPQLVRLDIRGNQVVDFQPIVGSKTLRRVVYRWGHLEIRKAIKDEIERVELLAPNINFTTQ